MTSILECSLNNHIQCSLNTIFKHSWIIFKLPGMFTQHLYSMFTEHYFKHSLRFAQAIWNVPCTFICNIHWMLFSSIQWVLQEHSGTFFRHSYLIFTECYFQTFIYYCTSISERSWKIIFNVPWTLFSNIYWGLQKRSLNILI